MSRAFSRVLIIGDSNARNMSEETSNDRYLSHYNITVRGIGGFRAMDLKNHLHFARGFNFVVIFCGNNDLTARRVNPRPVRTQLEVVNDLVNFTIELLTANVQVCVIGLMRRRDISQTVVQDINILLQAYLDTTTVKRFVAPCVSERHFLNDLVHLNINGRRNILRKLFDIMQKRFAL